MQVSSANPSYARVAWALSDRVRLVEDCAGLGDIKAASSGFPSLSSSSKGSGAEAAVLPESDSTGSGTNMEPLEHTWCLCRLSCGVPVFTLTVVLSDVYNER